MAGYGRLEPIGGPIRRVWLALVAGMILSGCLDGSTDVGDQCAPSPDAMPADVLGATLAIVDVSIVPTDGGDPIQNQTVILQGDRISEIGPANVVPIPSEAVIISGTCRFLMPGLVDMHAHISFFPEASLWVANGVTTVREMWGGPGHLRLRDAIALGDSIAPTLFQGTPGVDAVLSAPSTIVVADPSATDSVVAEIQAAGYDFLKVYEFLTEPLYDALISSARARGVRTMGHAPAPAGVVAVMASGQESIEHMANAFLPWVGANTPDEWWEEGGWEAGGRALARALASAGVAVVPTLTIFDALLTPEEEAAFANRPTSRFLPDVLLTRWERRGSWRGTHRRDDVVRNTARLLRIFREEGVRVLLGTDGGFTYITPGFAIHDEVVHYLEAGFSMKQIVRIVTRTAAEFMGGDFGDVREGCRADLLLLNANPFLAPENLQDRAGVILRGRWLSDEELQRLLEALATVPQVTAPAPISPESGFGMVHH